MPKNAKIYKMNKKDRTLRRGQMNKTKLKPKMATKHISTLTAQQI